MNVAKLALSHDPILRETPTSFVSRLAVLNLSPSANDFCLDTGLDWKAIVRGTEREIDRLAALADTDRSALQRYALRTVGASRFRIGSDAGTISTIHRSRTKLCTRCISESMEQHGLSGAFRRADWQLVSIRTCERHGLWLTPLQPEKYTIDNYDAARCIERHRNLFDEPERYATPTLLEDYLRGRLDGVRRGLWLDTLPMHIVSRLSEMLGARIEFGPTIRSADLTEEMLHKAGATGFAAIKGGQAALRRNLEGLKQEQLRKGGFQHAYDLGVFYYWLSASRAPKELRPIRRIVRSFIVENYPLDPGRLILGQAVSKPKLFSLEQVRRRLGMRPERVQRLIRHAGLHDTDLSRGISLQKFLHLETYVRQFVNAGEAASILGCSLSHLVQLQKTGLLITREMEAGMFRMHRRDLDAFLRPIADLPTVATPGTARTLWRTYNYVKCSIADIYRLILDGQLNSACRLPGPPSLSQVLVEPEEVRGHLSLQVPNDPHSQQTAKNLRTNQKTLHYLANRGLLLMNRRRHPVTRNLRWYVELRSLELFDEEFVTIGTLASEIGERPGPLSKRLSLLMINPIYSAPGISRIYHRAAIREILEAKQPPARPASDRR